MLILTKEHIKTVFSMKEAVDSVKEAYACYSAGKSIVPLRTNINVEKQQGVSLFMPGYVADTGSLGIKIVSVFPNNYKKGKATCPAQMILLDGETGEVCCIMDGTYLTQLRTGAGAGAATDILAIKHAKIAAIIGTGGQAFCQLEALLCVRNLEKVYVYSRNKEKLDNFVGQASEQLKHYGAEIIAAKSSDEAIENADIVTVITNSTKPVINGKKLKAGVHVNGVGSYTPNMQELDEDTVLNSDKIYVDAMDAIKAEAGDFIIPITKGSMGWEKIYGEIGSVVNNGLSGRNNDKENTLFKSVGISVQDVVTANKIYKKAMELGVGNKIEV